MSIEGIEDLPAPLARAIEAVVNSIPLDVTSARDMRGECQVLTDVVVAAVEEAIAAAQADDEDFEGESHPVQLFNAPRALVGNDMAEGHYVAWVSWDLDGEFWVDVTAAQFPELGHAGPVIRLHRGW